jgi:hypothetical protein
LFEYLNLGIDRTDKDLFGPQIPWQNKLEEDVCRLTLRKMEPHLMSMYYDARSNEVREVRGWDLADTFESLVHLATQKDGKFDHRNVEIVPLCEPLKIRTISKGNALKYWLAKPFQKSMRDLIWKFDQFALTKGPLEVSHLEWLWHQTDTLLAHLRPHCPGIDLEFTHTVSGDYKGATDGLDIRATKMSFEELLGKTEFPFGDEIGSDRLYKDVLRDVLYEQRLHYPEKYVDTGCVEQRNGQLMGSNLSFPILCVVNLVAYWRTFEEYVGLRIEPSKLPVLVNGDDILFRTPRPDPSNPRSFYELWKKNITEVGFTLSVGKNYIHDTVFTVNSECWVVGKSGNTPTFRRVHHLDVGLLTNNNRSARPENQVLPLGDRISRVLEGALDKDRAWRRLKHYYRKELKDWMQQDRYTTYNVFAAVQLGGLGVPTHGVDPKFTKYQRRYAGFTRRRLLEMTESDQLKDIEQILTTEKSGPGLSYQVPKCSRQIQWVGHERIDEDPELELDKDIRKLPTLARPQAVLKQHWIRTYSIKCRRAFSRALKDHIVPLDNDPTIFKYVPALVGCTALGQ